MDKIMLYRRIACLIVLMLLAAVVSPAVAADIYVRARVIGPAAPKHTFTFGAWVHVEPWTLPTENREAEGDQWTPWLDLTKWKLHGRLNREGGIAEWPAMNISIADGSGKPIVGCELEVQLADKPDPAHVVIQFREKGGSNMVAFLLPHPLREKKSEFETGSQMAARHAAWAKEATGGKPRTLKRFELLTSLWGHSDPVLARQEVETLKSLGFNVIGGAPWQVLRDANVKTYTATWHLVADPDVSVETWRKSDGAAIERANATEEGRWLNSHYAHYVVADEIQTMDLRPAAIAPEKLNGFFRDYLRQHGVSDSSLGKPIDQVEYPAAAMFEKTLPRDADLTTRKVLYYAAKFGQWWSVKQLRQTTELVKGSLPGMKTETLPSDHSFFNAWGPPHIGMAYRGLDFFEIGQQRAVDIISAEDWLGLNHMYGPGSTWTGAPAFAYLSAIFRSGIGDRPVALRGLITGSDDGFLRLKAYSALGQGATSFFFWTYGPTYISTENYWSDLRSEYDGIAKLSAALVKAEDVIMDAKVQRDPVALLYSVSHDFWHTDDPASFVENRLTWCALRHSGIQPDLLREEDVESGELKNYKVLYVTGQCLTRKAGEAIEAWVRQGGRVYLSAGAATRDEFFEPYRPPFAAQVWPDDVTQTIVIERGHRYSERSDLPRIKPMDYASVGGEHAARLPVIGVKAALRQAKKDPAMPAFTDGSPAAVRVAHGRGEVMAVGFLPGLAYAQLAGFKPTTLEEKWTAEPRELISLPLKTAQVTGVAHADQPVVESSLLKGEKASAAVLVNYTYEPIKSLKVTLRGVGRINHAESTEGVAVKLRTLNERDVEIELPLDWTDIVLLRP